MLAFFRRPFPEREREREKTLFLMRRNYAVEGKKACLLRPTTPEREREKEV